MGPKRLFNVLKIKKNVCINFNAFYGVSVLHKECQRHGEQGETQTGLYGGICRRTDRRTVGAEGVREFGIPAIVYGDHYGGIFRKVT